MLEKFPQTSIKTSEQQKAKEEKRETLRELLPPDLQLEFVQERPGKEKWQFEGELMKRRHSETEEDRLFFEAVKAISKRDIRYLKEIQEKSKEKKTRID